MTDTTIIGQVAAQLMENIGARPEGGEVLTVVAFAEIRLHDDDTTIVGACNVARTVVQLGLLEMAQETVRRQL